MIKPVVYLLLAFSILAIFAGAFLPLGGDPVFSMAAWFVLLTGGAAALCALAYRRRSRVVGARESPAEFLNEILFNLLGVVGAGPFSALLFIGIARKSEPLDPRELVLPVIAIVVACWSAWSMFTHLTRK